MAAYERKIDKLTDDCPVKAALDVIRGRWKPLILRELLGGTKRFTELHAAIPGVTAQTLSLQLRQLEADEIVARKVYAEVPARVEYHLTEYGLTLSPVFDELETWGEAYQRRHKARAR